MLSPAAILPFPQSIRCWFPSGRLPCAGTRSLISSASSPAGFMRARSSPRKSLWGGPAPITVADFDDFIIWITLGIILGGRIGYVLFYNLPHFAAHPVEIFELWNGGMSFHGGVLGCIVATVAFRAIPGLAHAVARRCDDGGGADRTVPRPPRQFHQWRIVGPADRRAVGDDLSQWRPDPAPPQPTLRSGARRASSC